LDVGVLPLTASQRQAHWDWCREFIDGQAIYRADETHPAIPGKFGGHYRWQFYMRRATFNPHFARALGLLFRPGRRSAPPSNRWPLCLTYR
jgi:hypothetical protein